MTRGVHSIALAFLAGCGLPVGSEIPTTGAGGTGYPTYYIGEQNFYNAPFDGCMENTHLAVVGAQLNTALKSMAWIGQYGQDHNPCDVPKCAEPADYVEGSAVFANALQGADHLWADNATFAVFAGHGAHDALEFRRSNVTSSNARVCGIRFNSDVLLGSGWGGRTRVAAWAASCVGYAADLNEAGGADDFHDSLGQSGSWQHLGFYDSPRIHPDQLAGFVDQMQLGGVDDNLTAWIDSQWLYSFQDEYYNQPIVWTGTDTVVDAGQPSDYIGTRHESANLFTGDHLPPPSPTMVDRAMFTASFDDGDPGNGDPVPTDCIDNIIGN